MSSSSRLGTWCVPVITSYSIHYTKLYDIGRDTLRVWERRYGFPEPVRNEKGERAYSEKQLRRLQRIRRLLDLGMRPGKLLPLSENALDKLEAGLQPGTPQQPQKAVSALLDAICSAVV